MENQKKGSRKLWKPPSVEDFNVESQCKRIKLDQVELENVKEQVGMVQITEPRTVDELATHPKKIEEIKNWFERTASEKAPILLITGPAGSAKTVTLKVVASSLNISIREWVNPVDKTYFNPEILQLDKSDFVESRQIDKFEEFIFRASRYKSLFDMNDLTAVLVEDFPNILIWKPKLFNDFLEKYQLIGRSPIVFICTDDQNLNLSNDLFPSSVKTKYKITEIKFNPVNQSSLMRTLKKVIGKCPNKQSVAGDTLQSIVQSSNGDLRNALSNLEILLASSKSEKTKKPVRRREKVTSQSAISTEAISMKDNKAEFYQSLGRVLYPKRKESTKTGDNLKNENRIFIHDVMEISSSFSHSFLMLLHENYVSTFNDLKSVTEAANNFSVSDLFLRQIDLEDYASLIGVAGLMISNKNPKREGFKPIKKSGAPNKGSNDIWMKRFDYSHLNATCDVLNVDFIPYLKVLREVGKGRENTRNEEIDTEEDFEIEEFDD